MPPDNGVQPSGASGALCPVRLRRAEHALACRQTRLERAGAAARRSAPGRLGS